MVESHIERREDIIMTKIAFLTLGCKLNYAETSTYEREFVRHGLEVVPWNARADVYLVNTCTVTEHSDKKCRNIIRKVHRVSPKAAIIVTGCYAQLKRDEILKIEGVKAVFGASEKGTVVPFTMRLLEGGTPVSGDSACGDFFPAYSSGERTRSFLKVQDGCDYFCAYCTVPYARGRSRNIPIAEAVAQAREIAAAGIREIVLTGVNTGDFGKTTGESFLDLLKALDRVEGIERYRISSIEPNLLTEEKMETCGRPKVFFGIDVIVGFPGETDEMFESTVSFLSDRVKPAFIHVFPYSKRAGTRAALRKDQVSESVKTARVERLERLSDELHGAFVESCRGRIYNVLFESTDRKGMMSGYTENYIRVERPYDASLSGQIVEIELK